MGCVLILYHFKTSKQHFEHEEVGVSIMLQINHTASHEQVAVPSAL